MAIQDILNMSSYKFCEVNTNVSHLPGKIQKSQITWKKKTPTFICLLQTFITSANVWLFNNLCSWPNLSYKDCINKQAQLCRAPGRTPLGEDMFGKKAIVLCISHSLPFWEVSSFGNAQCLYIKKHLLGQNSSVFLLLPCNVYSWCSKIASSDFSE